MAAEQRREDGSESKSSEWPGPLCSHLTRPCLHPRFSQVWNVSCSLDLKKTIINVQNYLELYPTGYHLPNFCHFFLDSRLCPLEAFLAVSKAAQGYYAFIFLTQLKPHGV